MKPMELIGALARMETSRENADDPTEALDTVIALSRKMLKGNRIPAANFMHGGWSFRRSLMVEGGPGGKVRGVSFAVYPKGERSHWAVKASIYQAGETWHVHPRNGYVEGFILFNDARDRAVEIANQKGENR